MGLFSFITEALADQGLASPVTQVADALSYAAEADNRTIRAFADVIAERSDLPFMDALLAVTSVARDGGPDLRTPKGWACASVILGVPGQPVMPTIH